MDPDLSRARTAKLVAIFVTILAASGAGAWLLLHEEGRDEGTIDASKPQHSIRSSGCDAAPLAPAAELESGAGVARTPEAAQPAPPPTEPASSRGLLSGRVIVTDVDGSEHAAESGELVVSIPAPKDDAPPRPLPAVAVVAGAFELAAEGGADLRVSRLVLGGRLAVAEPPKLAPDANRNVVVRARWPAPTVLRVRDSASGRELADVPILSLPELSNRPRVEECTSDQIIRAHVASPIEITCLPQRQLPYGLSVWWEIVAPGHVTTNLQLDLRTGGERIVSLGSSASLEVTLRNWHPVEANAAVPPPVPLVQPPPRPFVRVRRYEPLDFDAYVEALLAERREKGEATPDRDQARRDVDEQIRRNIVGREVKGQVQLDGPDPVRIDGLEPGATTVSVELGDVFHDKLLLAWAQVELRAGATMPVTLDLDLPPAIAPPAPLSGVVDVPLAWGDEPWSLEFRSAERDRDESTLTLSQLQMELVPGAPSRHRFRLAAVSPGFYVARVTGLESQRMIFQVDGGSNDVVIEVPPPATTTIALRDARTREPLDVGVLELSPEQTPGIDRWRPLSFEFDPGAKGYVVRAAAGNYDLNALDWRHRVSPGQIALTGGNPRIELEIERNCGVTARLRDGATLFSGNEIVQRIRIVPHERGRTGFHYFYEPDRVHIAVPGSGSYDLSVRVPAGYMTIPDRVVEIPDGEFIDVDVELERSR